MARRDAQALGLLTAFAFGLRLVHLGRFELWVDEAATWWFSRMVWGGELASAALQEPTPPVYYALIGLLTRIFGEHDVVLRLPSAVAGALSIPAVWLLGRRLFGLGAGERIGWLAALLLAIHPLHIFYSREARVYTLLLLLTTVLVERLWNALEAETWGSFLQFTAILMAICALHVSGYFLGVAVGVQILIGARSWRGRWRGLVAAALAGLALLPYTLWALPQMQGTRAAWSVENLYRVLPEEGSLARTFEMQLLGADYFAYLRQMDQPPTPQRLRWLAVGAQGVLVLAALGWGLARARRRPTSVLVAGWWLSILVPWGLSRAWQTFYHPGRHDFYTVGLVMVVLAAGVEALGNHAAFQGGEPRGSWLGQRKAVLVTAVVLLPIVVGALMRGYWLHQLEPTRHYRPKGEWIADHTDPTSDRVIAFGILRPITEHYTRLAGSTVRFESFPSETDLHAGWSDDRTLIEDPEALESEARARIAALSEPGGPRRLLVLLRPYQRTDDAFSATWLVDRHWLGSLRRAGWRPVPGPEGKALGIEVFERPTP